MKAKNFAIVLGTYFGFFSLTVSQDKAKSSRNILKELIRKLDSAADTISDARLFADYSLMVIDSVIDQTIHDTDNKTEAIDGNSRGNTIELPPTDVSLRFELVLRYLSSILLKSIKILVHKLK